MDSYYFPKAIIYTFLSVMLIKIIMNIIEHLYPYNKEDETSKEIEKQKKSIHNMLTSMKPEDRVGWLTKIYDTYYNKFHSDNKVLWGTGRILFPLSLGAFALIVQNKLNLLHTLLLGVTSISLIVMWWLIFENHRAFQDKSAAILEAIEQKIGFKEASTLENPNPHSIYKLPCDYLNKIISCNLKVHNVIRVACLSVVIVWFFIFFINYFNPNVQSGNSKACSCNINHSLKAKD